MPSSPRARPTRRSRPTSSCPTRRSRTTSARSWPSSTSSGGPRRPPMSPSSRPTGATEPARDVVGAPPSLRPGQALRRPAGDEDAPQDCEVGDQRDDRQRAKIDHEQQCDSPHRRSQPFAPRRRDDDPPEAGDGDHEGERGDPGGHHGHGRRCDRGRRARGDQPLQAVEDRGGRLAERPDRASRGRWERPGVRRTWSGNARPPSTGW